MKKCHIFSGSQLENAGFITILDGDMVICADSGLFHADRLGIIPDIIVGDFDSYKGRLPENAYVKISPSEKDDTDTMLAVKAAIENGAQQIIIYGALGGRFDHTFANIQALKYAEEHSCKACIEDQNNIIMIQSRGEKRYKRREGWYFSFFSYSESLVVEKLSGVKYTLENAVITNGFPIGVSNEFTANEAVLRIKSGTALVVLSKM